MIFVELIKRSLLLFLFFNGLVFNLFASEDETDKLFDSYDVKFYFINIEASNANTNIKGNTEILIQYTISHVDSIGLELSETAIIDSIVSDGKNLNFTRKEDTIKIALSTEKKAGDFSTITIFYKFSGNEADTRKGINNRTIPSGAKVTWTITEPFYAKNWFPCKQFLTDKADSAYIYVTIPDSLMVGSNGLLSGIFPVDSNKKRFEWKTRYPIAFYLISFAVANYMDYSFYAKTADGDSVLVQNYIYNDSSYFLNNKRDIDSVKALINAFSKRFGPYPFKNEKYGHCLAPAGGGMENQTMTTLSSFAFGLVAHELAHSWFGDHITCSDWQNIWINEGFASYGEFVAYEELGTREDLMEWLNSTQADAKLATEGSVYVPDDEKDNTKRLFDHPLSYKKGAMIIHMLRSVINNDDLFFEVIRTFQTRYAFSNASGEDFKKIVEEKTQIDFDTFFQQWFYGEGFPTINISWEQEADSVILYFEQTTSAPVITPFFNFSMDFKFEYLGGDTTHKILIDQNSQVVKIPCTQRVYNIVADPDLWILKNLNGAHRILPTNKHAYFTLFPNPAINQLYIQNLDIGKPFHVQIYDLSGVLRMEMDGADAFTLINLEKLESGVYQVVIIINENREVYQLIKT